MTSSDVVQSALAHYFRMIQAELHEVVELFPAINSGENRIRMETALAILSST